MTWVRYSLISTTLPRPKATLTRGNDVYAHRRAGDHHSCALQRERRQVGDVRARQKPRQLSRDAHSSASHRRIDMRRSLALRAMDGLDYPDEVKGASSSARCRLRRFGRSFANRCTPAKIESGSRCASAITSASVPPVSHTLPWSAVREYSSVSEPTLRSGHMRRVPLITNMRSWRASGGSTLFRYASGWRSNSSSLIAAMTFTLMPAPVSRGSTLTRLNVELDPWATT